jgi:uncharacterized protein (DUF433 family)
MSGTPCFAGTRVPVKSLFDHLRRNHSIEYFLEQFPTVRPEQVTEILELGLRSVLATAERVVA